MSGPSETRLGLHPARGDGGLERREVALVLVSARACVGARERPALPLGKQLDDRHDQRRGS